MAAEKKIPEIRFKGFEGEWEESILSSVTDYKNGKGNEDKQSTSGKYELINLNSISIDGGLKNSGKFIDKTDNTLIENDLVMVLSDVGHGDLLGRVALIPENNKYVLNQRVALLRPNNKVNPLFLFVNINAHQSYFKVQGAGMSQLNISKRSVENFNSLVPTLPEQTQIGTYFQNLDSLISLHQRKYDKLLTVKKAMLVKMFPKEGADVPEIRFKGFEGKWEVRKFGETFMNLSNTSLSRANLNYNNGIAKNIHYGDVLIKFGELLNIKKEEVPYITDDSVVGKFFTSKLQNGDIIIADAAEDFTVGKCTELMNLDNEIVISGLHTIPVRPLFSFATGYLGYFLNTSLYHNQLLSLIQGSKVSSISKTAIKNTNVFYPKEKDEQTKIGTFFQNLDTQISLHQKQLEKLKNIKKACLEKMFV